MCLQYKNVSNATQYYRDFLGLCSPSQYLNAEARMPLAPIPVTPYHLPMLSIIIPTLNSASDLPPLLRALDGAGDEVIVSDGGSVDDTLAVAASYGARLAVGGAGRGQQLLRAERFCAAQSPDDWLLFLHADSQLPDGFGEAVRAHMDSAPDRAGYFKFALDDQGFWPRMVEAWVHERCYWLALPYGDQGLLVRRDVYRAAGGYPAWPLFEDVKIVRRLRRRRLLAIDLPITTSAQKYIRDGYKARTFKNLGLLIRFLIKGSPDGLTEKYK